MNGIVVRVGAVVADDADVDVDDVAVVAGRTRTA